MNNDSSDIGESCNLPVMDQVARRALAMRSPDSLSAQGVVDAWRSYAPRSTAPRILPVHNTLGVVAARPGVTGRILSIDMCEIVRMTHRAFAATLGYDASFIGQTVWSYGGYGIDGTGQLKLSSLLINEHMVQPVPEIAKIRRLLRIARRKMLIVANTSTAVGTERATIEFLHDYLPGCFDGILFARNYDGTGPATKGHALMHLLQTLHVPVESARVAHIDDAPHHNEHVLRVLSEQRAAVRATMPLFMPGSRAMFESAVVPPANIATAPTVIDALIASIDYVSDQHALLA